MQQTDGVSQAVVVVHGMGEQRPLDTLCRFIDAGQGTSFLPDPEKLYEIALASDPLDNGCLRNNHCSKKL